MIGQGSPKPSREPCLPCGKSTASRRYRFALACGAVARLAAYSADGQSAPDRHLALLLRWAIAAAWFALVAFSSPVAADDVNVRLRIAWGGAPSDSGKGKSY